ncbi:MAG: hypothetical protein H7222_08735 [Methylotenera sp.]|nr:hypothetical protein [Oligoflexia bacterium]
MTNRSGKLFDAIYSHLLSEKIKDRSEKIILVVAMVSFVLHLGLIMLVEWGIVQLAHPSRLLSNPISAIYTPFSFILIYEVYLLVYHLPQSTSTYIAKQYEILTLIVIRKVFKDLSGLVFTQDWFKVSSDVQFTYDLVATLVLFLLILTFYRLNQREIVKEMKSDASPTLPSLVTQKFIRQKQVIAACLMPLFFGLALYSLISWANETFFALAPVVGSVKDINKIFFDEFFTVLILVDVLLLLFSLFHTDKFSKIMRNSGFIISTILIKLSFGVAGVVSTLVLVLAVAFGVAILAIHNQFEKLTVPKNT